MYAPSMRLGAAAQCRRRRRAGVSSVRARREPGAARPQLRNVIPQLHFLKVAQARIGKGMVVLEVGIRRGASVVDPIRVVRDDRDIPVTDLDESKGKKHSLDISVGRITTTSPTTPLQPIPRYPLTVAWAPSTLCFNLNEEKVVKQLTVRNSNAHSIFVQCRGLWDSSARLGASWRCYPRRRFLLAPGVAAALAVSAAPRPCTSPLASAQLALQLVAAHMRDNIAGYFMIPIHVHFNNYTPLYCIGE
ncbi:uncharacterized protein LOC134662596 [Cydia amplana]|uniref:uncharacterized protein LOC134662596 n=1 Tax=Cydia amplana TaxID=1869771 RepID=UPI002FE699A5